MAKLNIITLGSSKNYTDLAALGLTNVVVNDTDKTISFTLVADGSTRTLHFNQPSDGKDGVSITNISIDANNNLVCTMSDGTEYKSKIDLLDNVYTKTETDTLLLDKAEKNHNHDSAYASKDTEHEHTNKETLDKFGVNDGGKLTFNGDVVTPEAMDLGDYLKKTDAQNTYVAKETGKGLSENDFTTVLKDAYDKAVEDSHTHSNKSIIDKFSENSDGKLLYDGQSIEADLSTVYKKTETYSQTESDDKFVAKESGKGLSTNDYTTEEKEKLAGLENYDDSALSGRVKTIEDDYVKSADIPTKVSQLENDNNYLTSIPEEYITETELEAKGYLTEHQDISNLVEKEDGKTLISTDDISQITKNKDAITTLNGTGEGSVDKKIADKLSEQTYLTKEIATADEVVAYIADPTTAKFNVIYLVKDETVSGSDKYFEYQRIGNEDSSTFEMTGDTSTQLSNYYQKDELSLVATSGSYNDLTDLPEFETVNIDFTTEY